MKWYEWLVGGIIILAVLALMLVGIYDVNLRYQLVRVQTAPTMVAPLPALVVTPGSEVAALQQVVETQQAQINDLNRDLAKAKEDQQRDSIDIRWSLDSKLLMAGALASLAGLLGIGAYANIGEKVRERVRAMLDETILGYDPAWVPVYLPRGQKLLHDRLDYAGLKSIRLYANNALAPRPGITVVTVLDKDDEDQLAEFLQRTAAELDPKRMGFILYTGDYSISNLRALVHLHDNLTPANTPTTLVSHVFNVGRGMRSERRPKGDVPPE